MNYSPIDWKQYGPGPVIGVDEVGRGCLAGPVYAAAVVLNEEHEFSHYTDSKKISASRRTQFAKEIESHHQVGIGFATLNEIFSLNILNASLLAMRRAVENLNLESGYVLVDGNKKIPDLKKDFQQTTVVKGDLRVSPIAAASIVAKVTRDNLLIRLAEKYPGYGFENHKGYATSEHKEAIQKLGPTKEHRASFAGVKEFL